MPKLGLGKLWHNDCSSIKNISFFLCSSIIRERVTDSKKNHFSLLAVDAVDERRIENERRGIHYRDVREKQVANSFNKLSLSLTCRCG